MRGQGSQTNLINMKTEEIIGAASGGAIGSAAGLGTTAVTVSAAGSVTGLSAAGFTSGLAAIGAGSMYAGAIIATGGIALLAAGGTFAGIWIARKISQK
jgi:hypothetical protein